MIDKRIRRGTRLKERIEKERNKAEREVKQIPNRKWIKKERNE